MIKVLIDSTVFVSAIVFGGVPREVVQLAEAGKFEFIASKILRSEVERILKVKFRWAQKNVQAICGPLWKQAQFAEPKEIIEACRDPGDNYLVSLALETNAQIIVTGDRDLLELDNLHGLEVIPRQHSLLKSAGKKLDSTSFVPRSAVSIACETQRTQQLHFSCTNPFLTVQRGSSQKRNRHWWLYLGGSTPGKASLPARLREVGLTTPRNVLHP